MVEYGYGDLTGKAAQGVKALITTAQNMVLEVGKFHYLYGKTNQAAVNQGIKRFFIGSMVKIIGTTTGMPLVSAGVNVLISIFSSWENINMGKYFVLGIFFATLLITRIFATQLQGGLRFSGSNKMMVNQTSLIRKILLGKKKKIIR